MWFQLVLAVVMMVVSYLLTPRPKQSQPTYTSQDQENPTAEAGRSLPVIFGTVLLKSPNVLWYGDKATNEYDWEI